jgi:hypothetical protein
MLNVFVAILSKMKKHLCIGMPSNAPSPYLWAINLGTGNVATSISEYKVRRSRGVL